MFCSKCGRETNARNFCPYCGTPLNSASSGSSYGSSYGSSSSSYGGGGYYSNPTGGGYYGGSMGGGYGSSYQCTFDGEGGEYFGIHFVNTLLLLITCGIAFPWVYCRNLRWRKSHTIINGRRLEFTGEGGDLLGKWIIWSLLSFITCGIYAYWAAIRLKEWECAHTCFEYMNPMDGQTFGDSYFDGSCGERIGVMFVNSLLTVITCGIYRPWAVVKMTKFDLDHTVVKGNRLMFNGTGSAYWGESFIIGLLTAITCGIYYCWGVVKINKWVFDNTVAFPDRRRGY